VPTLLEMKADAAGPAAKVEDAPADKTHCLALIRLPLPEGSQVALDPLAFDEAVVSLDHNVRVPRPRQVVAQRVPECVLAALETGSAH
jgi:hypothetical protein